MSRETKRLDELPELVTVREVSGVLRCCDSTVREMLRRGELQELRVGRKVLIRRVELERFVRGETKDEAPRLRVAR